MHFWSFRRDNIDRWPERDTWKNFCISRFSSKQKIFPVKCLRRPQSSADDDLKWPIKNKDRKFIAIAEKSKKTRVRVEKKILNHSTKLEARCLITSARARTFRFSLNIPSTNLVVRRHNSLLRINYLK